jgi:hypothetical protein
LYTVLLCGCNENAVRVPVSGQVTIDGKPLSSGSIRFVPENGRPVSSPIDDSGRFQLKSDAVGQQPVAGVMPGLYRVAVTSNEIVAEEKAVWNTPRKYADFRTSGLEVVIDRPVDELKIELTSEVESSEANDSQLENDGDVSEEKSQRQAGRPADSAADRPASKARAQE